MNCEECKARLAPDDPTQPMWMPDGRVHGRAGHFLPALCDVCSNPRRDEVVTVVRRQVTMRQEAHNYPVPVKVTLPKAPPREEPRPVVRGVELPIG